jgi:hypothetical protein
MLKMHVVGRLLINEVYFSCRVYYTFAMSPFGKTKFHLSFMQNGFRIGQNLILWNKF